MTRNKLTQFRPWKLETLIFLQTKKTCILRTMISSLVNKNYYYIVILFLCYAFLRYIVSHGQMKLIVNHKCTFIWCSYHFIHRFVLFFSILNQKEKFYVKRKNNTQPSCMIFFFLFYVGWAYILRVSWFIKAESQWI